MESLLIHIPTPYQEIPALNLALACEKYQATYAHGLLIAQAKSAQQWAALLLLNGAVYQGYAKNPDGSFQRIAYPTFLDFWTTPTILIRAIELPASGVELIRLLLEGAPPSPVPTAQLKNLPQLLSSNLPEARILRILWKNGESILRLVPGTQPQNVMHIQGGRVLTGGNALASFYSQKEAPVIAEWYYPRQKNESSQVSLADSYNALLGFLLARYRDLVGQHLVNSILFDLNAQLMSQGVPARLTPYGWELEAAVSEEASLVALSQTINTALLRRMEQVLGSRLSRNVFKEAKTYLGRDYLEILEAHHLIGGDA